RPVEGVAAGGGGPKCRGGAVRRAAGEITVVSWLASLAPPPRLRRCSPVPLPLHGGEVLDGPAAGAEDFSPTKRLAEWGSGTKCRGGAVRRTAGKSRWGAWLAWPAPPPRLRRCSPVPLPLHGGEVPMPRYQVPSTRNGDMKIVVIGGTGYAGASIVSEAARRGHEVVAVSRSGPAIPLDGVEYIQTDVHADLPDLAGADVVVVSMSPRGDNAGRLRSLYLEIGRKAEEVGARLIVIGGFSSLRPAPDAPRFVEGDIPPAYAPEAKEMHSILEALQADEVDGDWLFVSPAGKYGSYNPGSE